MPTNLSDALISAQTVPTVMRTGVVTTVGTTSVFVLVADTQIEAAYLSSYSPAIGHLVALLRQDSTWLVLGRLAGSAIIPV